MNFPARWRKEKLSDCLEKIIDYRGKSTPKDNSGFQLITARNVKFGYIEFTPMEYMNPSDYKVWMTRGIPRPGDVLFTTEAPLGNVALYPSEGTYALAQRLLTLRPNKKILDSNYLLYFLLSDFGQNQVKIRATGSTATGIRQSEIRKVPIILPPLPEQRKIAEILSAWDEAIALTEQLIAAFEKRKKGLMQRLLTSEVRFPGFEGEWKEFKLSDLGETFPGLSGKTKENFGRGKPFLTYMNIFNNSAIDIKKVGYVDVKEGEKQNRVQYGDIFFTISSETAEDIGMSSVLLEKIEEYYLNSFCFGFRLNNFDFLLPEFARFLFRGTDFRKNVSHLAQGFTRYNLSKAQLMKILISLPDKEEQRKISSLLGACAEEIYQLQKYKRYLEMQKKGLMQRLLTGEVRVRV